MPLIEIKQAAEADPQTSASIIREVTDAYARAAGVPADKVWVVLHVIPRDLWGTGGTTLAERDRAMKQDR